MLAASQSQTNKCDDTIDANELLTLLKHPSETIDSNNSGMLLSYLSSHHRKWSQQDAIAPTIDTEDGNNDQRQHVTHDAMFEEITLESLKCVLSTDKCSSGKVARRIASDGLLLLTGGPHTSLLEKCVEIMVNSPDGDIGMELLMPSYLSRLDDEKEDFVDEVLDVLCCCSHRRVGDDGGSEVVPNRRISNRFVSRVTMKEESAAVITASLRELEIILPHRLSRRCCGGGSSGGDNRNDEGGAMMQSVDRITPFLDRLFHCLESISNETSSHSIPPLVYQILLFVSSVPSATKDHVMRSLTRLSSRFSSLFPPSNNKDDDANRNVVSVQYNVGSALSLLSTVIRQNQDLSQNLLKLIQTAAPSEQQRHTSSSLRHESLTPFLTALLLSSTGSLPRSRVASLTALKTLMVEEEQINIQKESSCLIKYILAKLSPPRSSSSSTSSSSSSHHVLSTLQALSSLCSHPPYGLESLTPILVQLSHNLIDITPRDSSYTSSSSINKTNHPSPSSTLSPPKTRLSNHGLSLLSQIITTNNNAATDYSDPSSSSSSTISILLRQSSEKFCGGTPNALLHSRLLSLLPTPLLTEHTCSIVDYLSHVSNGGLPPLVARMSVVPALKRILPYRRNDWDKVFLYGKKALFGGDDEARMVGGVVLVMLGGLMESDDEKGGGSSSSSGRNDGAKEEVRGYLRRCLSQYGYGVRKIIYDELIADDNTMKRGRVGVLKEQLERYVVVSEGEEERLRRMERAARHGSSLSQGSSLADDEELENGIDWGLCLGRRAAKIDDKAGLLERGIARIVEPLPVLIHRCMSVKTNDDDIASLLEDLRRNVAKYKMDRVLLLSEDDDNNGVDKVRTVALCLLVASTAEILMDDVSSAFHVTDRLFQLRTDAIERCIATIASSIKTKKQRSPAAKKKKKSSQSQDNDDFASTTTTTSSKVTTPSASVIEKVRLSVEDAIKDMTPLLSFQCLAKGLKDCGAKKTPKDDDDDDDDEPMENCCAAQKRLIQNATYRQFLVDKSLHLLSSPLPLSALPPPSLQLGPHLLLEFVHQVRTKIRTSLSKPSKFHTPLALLSLRGFRQALQNMARDDVNDMTNEKRVTTILKVAVDVITNAPNGLTSKEWIDTSFDNENDNGNNPEPKDELLRLIRGFWNILRELIQHGLEGEAMECVEIIKYAASVFEDEGTRRKVGRWLIKAWNSSDDQATNTILGLEYDTPPSKCPATAANAVQVAIELDGGVYPSTAKDDDDRTSRKNDKDEPRSLIFELTSALLVHFNENDFIPTNFQENLKTGGLPSKRRYQSPLLKSIIETPPSSSGSDFTKELAVACHFLLHPIDNALSDIDFVLQKIIKPSLAPSPTSTALRHLLELSHSFSRHLSLLLPCAETVDDYGQFATTLLKTCRKLYATSAKLAATQSDAIARGYAVSTSARKFWEHVTTVTTPRIMSLLLTMQEKQRSGGNKMLADSKIESYGKMAAMVVFEKERSDKALIKMSAKLKGGDREGGLWGWLERGVLLSTSRDFRIKRKEMDRALERETARDSSGGKRKRGYRRDEGRGEEEEDDEQELGSTAELSGDSDDDKSDDAGGQDHSNEEEDGEGVDMEVEDNDN